MSGVARDVVSTILPVHNRPAMLREAVESVLAQTYRPIEVIIVDDGSTDATRATIADLQARWPREVRSIAQQNAGASAARNMGLAHARGEYVQYLDSDDLLLPDKFRLQVEDLRRNPDASVSYCITSRPSPDDPSRTSHRTVETFDTILPHFLCTRGWPTIAPLWRRSACDAVGPWSPLRVMEDWEYDCRAGILGIRPVHTAAVLCVVRDHHDPRASGTAQGYTRPQWSDYITAHEHVYARLVAADLIHHATAVPLARALFLASRQCALRDYADEAHRAWCLARLIAGAADERIKLALYRAAAAVAGWRNAARSLERLWRFASRSAA